MLAQQSARWSKVMIIRIWRGWAATAEAADAYQEFLRSTFLPSIHALQGYCGATVLRRKVGEEIEFMTLTRFDSVDAIRGFAGEDYESAHVAPRARELLSRFDARCQHFEWVVEDQQAPGTLSSAREG
jgi:heme-degrading monooxygenase HmoA